MVVVEVDVEVVVVVVVVSHLLQVRSHCVAIEVNWHSSPSKRRSHLARGKIFVLFAHTSSVDVVELLVEVVLVVVV